MAKVNIGSLHAVPLVHCKSNIGLLHDTPLVHCKKEHWSGAQAQCIAESNIGLLHVLYAISPLQKEHWTNV